MAVTLSPTALRDLATAFPTFLAIALVSSSENSTPLFLSNLSFTSSPSAPLILLISSASFNASTSSSPNEAAEGLPDLGVKM